VIVAGMQKVQPGAIVQASEVAAASAVAAAPTPGVPMSATDTTASRAPADAIVSLAK
jgi:hypothetical protein